MQLPRSYVDGRAPAYDVKKKPQVLPATCAAATQALTDRDVVACYTSAARELALIASDEGVRWAQQHQERGADSHTWGDLSDAWERALRSCRLFPDEYQAMCEEQVASSPAVNIPASFPFRGEACDVWAALDHQELCMETLAERTTQPQ